MRLYYFQSSEGNLGDDLNPWIWSRLLPEVVDSGNAVPAFRSQDLDAAEGPLFIGIGTLLNQNVPPAPYKVVFGAGVGYGPPPMLDERWKVYCVRGPRSAEALSIDLSKGIADPAVLLRTMDLPQVNKMYDASLMLHHESLESASWESFCEDNGVNYIEPTDTLMHVLMEIKRSRVLFTEAMHGAIVADALRVPWVPLQLHAHINALKWKDWCQSVGLVYNPVSPQWRPIARSRSTHTGAIKRKIKMTYARYILKDALKNYDPLLSTDEMIDRRCSQLQELLEQLTADYHSGLIAPKVGS